MKPIIHVADTKRNWQHFFQTQSVADPGFPVRGEGAPTSDTGAFQRKRMRKRKNWIPLEGAPLDPPMTIQGWIQDFPFGGRGRQPPTWVLFSGNVCENERIGSCWKGAPLDPPMTIQGRIQDFPLGEGPSTSDGSACSLKCIKRKNWVRLGGLRPDSPWQFPFIVCRQDILAHYVIHVITKINRNFRSNSCTKMAH